ncbi:UPF0721 transmembrane protein [Marinobacterium nitratireducens]|uniref:Probable membrane transporter protein n=1 Tax=Marinobacterium nitratireducens TaxID=518897 RepID=A0A918DYY0_9GAMM|nr:sulfite exporter TauE/SafE family protein [Marinobacterium nitratireducens]GGO88936.1 UPF0721 transmembrane protein [Marinobacterium nitratireducens]
MIQDPFFYLVSIPAVLIVGISKGGLGGGLGLIAVPLMALAVPPTTAAAIMLPILCLMDLVGLWKYRGLGDKSSLGVLLPAAVVGIILGALTFRYLSDDHIRLIVGTIAILFTLNYYLRSRGRGARAPSRIRGSLWGSLAGFTSFSVHAGGAPLNIYLLPLRLEKADYIATTIVFFAAVNYIKLVPYTLLGQFNSDLLLTSAVLAIFAPVGVLSGAWLQHRINQQLFYHLCYGFLLLAGIKLYYDALG